MPVGIEERTREECERLRHVLFLFPRVRLCFRRGVGRAAALSLVMQRETGMELVCSQGTVGGKVTIAQASSSGMGEIRSLGGGRYKPGFPQVANGKSFSAW